MWAIKKNRTLFYGIPFEIYSDHQPLRNLGSLAEKNNRVQRWYDFLSAYTYELKYRPGRENLNADLMSRLPLPATPADEAPDVRLTDPSDLDVYMIGASGVLPSRLGPVLCANESHLDHRDSFVVGENGCRSIPLTTEEVAEQTWRQIQQHSSKETMRSSDERTCVPDGTRLVDPGNTVVSGQWEPGLVLHAVPITEVGRRLLGLKSEQVHAITSGGGSSSGGGGSSSGGGGSSSAVPSGAVPVTGAVPAVAGAVPAAAGAVPAAAGTVPTAAGAVPVAGAPAVAPTFQQEFDEADSEAAREFGEQLCSKTAKDWADAQARDNTANAALGFIEKGVGARAVKQADLPDGVEEDEVKRLVSQGTILVLPNSSYLLVKRESTAPAARVPPRNPGRFKRLVGNEPRCGRTFLCC